MNVQPASRSACAVGVRTPTAHAVRLLVAAQDRELTRTLQEHKNLVVLDIDPGPTPTQERMSLALLEAVAQERLHSGAHVVALYNGIGQSDRPEP